MSTENNVRKLQIALLQPTIGLGVSVAYLFSFAPIMAFLTQIFGDLVGGVQIALATIVPLISCALSIYLTVRARSDVADHLASPNNEERVLARAANTFSRMINITAIVVAGIIALVSGIASAIGSAVSSGDLGAQDGSRLTFVISFVVGLAVVYYGIRSSIVQKGLAAAPESAAAVVAEVSSPTADSTVVRKQTKGSAINALVIPIFAFVVVPVIATQVLSTTRGEGAAWVTYFSLIAVAASLFFAARMLANAVEVRDESGKLLGGTVLARQWIFALNFVFLAIGAQILWGVSVALSIRDSFNMNGGSPSILDLLINLFMPIIVVAAMLGAQHSVLVYRAKTPQN